nr:uncharacterized protein CTRU02_04246 [Colletotrichum truncatum]KAF6796285.1 hypothetical protein CTRU02_04246 [Colletotrichum truncatum]
MADNPDPQSICFVPLHHFTTRSQPKMLITLSLNKILEGPQYKICCQ